MSVVTQMTHS